MKTAISIPDPLFRSADNLAERLGLSRSQLYVMAIKLFLAEHQRDNVTEALNKVYDKVDSSLEKQASALQMATLKRLSQDDEW
jgi:metal-responsive CopG/Arc/MetJ family transcriptional regulator